VSRPGDEPTIESQRLTTNDGPMTLLEMCDPEPPRVSVEATVADAIRTMLRQHVGAVGIVDREGRIAGIFTERDILRKVALSGRDPMHTPVLDVMTTPVELATLATTAAEALATMLERHYRHLPVVDDHGKLLGMLSIRNLLQSKIADLTRQLEYPESGRESGGAR
jgi:CBS domain-containing protein